MDVTRSRSAVPPAAAPPIVQPESNVRTEVRRDLHNSVRSASNPRRTSAFGLPCANCRLYYPASLDACPACNSAERVSANVSPAIPAPQTVIDPEPDAEALEQEREAFLQQFKSQLYAADAQASEAAAACGLGENHQETSEPATICKSCYDHLQERVDVFEAALHMDLKEAAQVVYDAVWADPSDPSKTYTNAAGALLTELRKRSGVSSLLGPFQPLGN